MDETIPALSLWQPWAWCILHAGKTVENRTWSTNYRGRIRIHASKTFDGRAWFELTSQGIHLPTESELRGSGQISAYVGEVTVVSCCPVDGLGDEWRDWAFGPICWLLKDPVAYDKPVPGRGYPGLYLPERFAKRKGCSDAGD